ncbi:hypothetical protein AXF42_Ash004042 [Apostasia shenzhenica]|uniref:Uncharacterized protein n=1 Tax=Apostasia shenzhenica TaxID=1088818 RepID=A0A2I0A1S0_9ASPA|nr:hypothetical protein AXF42_Ash004042 [Apostasia shenzhenica]
MDFLSPAANEPEELKPLPDTFPCKWRFETCFSVAGDLIQNCDLPPPINLFHPDLIPMDVPRRCARFTDECVESEAFGRSPCLLSALRRSQSLAREAERKEAMATGRYEKVAVMLLEESLRVMAARRWVMLLELEITALRREVEAAARAVEKEGADHDRKV